MVNYEQVIKQLKHFRDEREWAQFHDSKNLATAISIEAAELNEVFLWKSIDESEKVDVNKVREELADILSYAFLLADKHSLNPFEIVSEKIKINSKKYPIAKSKGNSTKYTEL